jgi:hypothetical protein
MMMICDRCMICGQGASHAMTQYEPVLPPLPSSLSTGGREVSVVKKVAKKESIIVRMMVCEEEASEDVFELG